MSEPKSPIVTIAAVRFLNARPLIYGLDRASDIRLLLDVPSKLIDTLRNGVADVALLPVIDYQKLDGLRVIPSGGIGSDGQTLTVRIFSKCPIKKIQTLACDPDSHTSIALARIILAEQFGIHPELTDLRESIDPEAKLLIGDKVVRHLNDPGHQLDLGEAWKNFTGLPFVFAVWTARADLLAPTIAARLEDAKKLGMAHIESLVRPDVLPPGWTSDVARHYLTEHLTFNIEDRELHAINQFFELCLKHQLLDFPLKSLRLFH